MMGDDGMVTAITVRIISSETGGVQMAVNNGVLFSAERNVSSGGIVPPFSSFAI
jgi:hypothetical protein